MRPLAIVLAMQTALLIMWLHTVQHSPEGIHSLTKYSSAFPLVHVFSAKPWPHAAHRAPPPLLHPHGMPHYAFVQMSTYRRSLHTFHVIGITSILLRKAGPPAYTCEWHPNNVTHDAPDSLDDTTRSQTAPARMLYVGFDENRELYVPAFVNCTFDSAVGADGYGGTLALSVFVGGRFVKETLVVAKKEARGELHATASSIQYEYAYCSPPIFRCSKPYWFLHWLTYHHYIFEGKAHFFFYDVGGLTDEIRAMMTPFMEAGLVTIIEAQDEAKYTAWYHNQVLFQNDCLQRSKAVAKWVVYHDFDEFLDVQPPWNLSSLLRKHEEMPWIRYGSIVASITQCASVPEDGDGNVSDESMQVDRDGDWLQEVKKPAWPMERVMCREKEPWCVEKGVSAWECKAHKGRRKYMVKASKVMTVGVHGVGDGEQEGLDLHASIARVYHFRGSLSAGVQPCSIVVNGSSPLPPRCFLDASFGQQAHNARIFASNLLGPVHTDDQVLL